MDQPIFELPQKVYGKNSKVITMRIAKDMLSDIDAAAKASNRTRNEVMTMALEFSLQHMVFEKKD